MGKAREERSGGERRSGVVVVLGLAAPKNVSVTDNDTELTVGGSA